MFTIELADATRGPVRAKTREKLYAVCTPVRCLGCRIINIGREKLKSGVGVLLRGNGSPSSQGSRSCSVYGIYG